MVSEKLLSWFRTGRARNPHSLLRYEELDRSRGKMEPHVRSHELNMLVLMLLMGLVVFTQGRWQRSSSIRCSDNGPRVSQRRMMARHRRVIGELLLVTAAVLAGIVVVEAAMRLVGADDALVWVPDPRVGWHQIPGAQRRWTSEGRGWVAINTLGYRDRERRLERLPGTHRVAVFGDSMTEGVQVNLDETFCYLVEEKFARGAQRVEVLNFGVNGYSPVQELLVMMEEVPRYRPDLVILALYLDNDVSGMHPKLNVSQWGAPYAVVERGNLRIEYSAAEASYEEFHRLPLYWLRKHSAIYRSISNWRWRQHAMQAEYRGSGSFPVRHRLYEVDLRPEWRVAWHSLERVLLEFKRVAEEHGVEFVVLSMPAPQVVDRHRWEALVESFPAMRRVQWDLDGPERRLSEFASENGIRLIQTSDHFKDALDGPPLFFDGLGHMTARGHQIMATLLSQFLSTRLKTIRAIDVATRAR